MGPFLVLALVLTQSQAIPPPVYGNGGMIGAAQPQCFSCYPASQVPALHAGPFPFQTPAIYGGQSSLPYHPVSYYPSAYNWHPSGFNQPKDQRSSFSTTITITPGTQSSAYSYTESANSNHGTSGVNTDLGNVQTNTKESTNNVQNSVSNPTQHSLPVNPNQFSVNHQGNINQGLVRPQESPSQEQVNPQGIPNQRPVGTQENSNQGSVNPQKNQNQRPANPPGNPHQGQIATQGNPNQGQFTPQGNPNHAPANPQVNSNQGPVDPLNPQVNPNQVSVNNQENSNQGSGNPREHPNQGSINYKENSNQGPAYLQGDPNQGLVDPQRNSNQESVDPQGNPPQRPANPQDNPNQGTENPQGNTTQRPANPQGSPNWDSGNHQGNPKQGSGNLGNPNQGSFNPEDVPNQKPVNPQGNPSQESVNPQGNPPQRPANPQDNPNQGTENPHGKPPQRPANPQGNPNGESVNTQGKPNQGPLGTQGSTYPENNPNNPISTSLGAQGNQPHISSNLQGNQKQDLSNKNLVSPHSQSNQNQSPSLPEGNQQQTTGSPGLSKNPTLDQPLSSNQESPNSIKVTSSSSSSVSTSGSQQMPFPSPSTTNVNIQRDNSNGQIDTEASSSSNSPTSPNSPSSPSSSTQQLPKHGDPLTVNPNGKNEQSGQVGTLQNQKAPNQLDISTSGTSNSGGQVNLGPSINSDTPNQQIQSGNAPNYCKIDAINHGDQIFFISNDCTDPEINSIIRQIKLLRGPESSYKQTSEKASSSVTISPTPGSSQKLDASGNTNLSKDISKSTSSTNLSESPDATNIDNSPNTNSQNPGHDGSNDSSTETKSSSDVSPGTNQNDSLLSKNTEKQTDPGTEKSVITNPSETNDNSLVGSSNKAPVTDTKSSSTEIISTPLQSSAEKNSNTPDISSNSRLPKDLNPQTTPEIGTTDSTSPSKSSSDINPNKSMSTISTGSGSTTVPSTKDNTQAVPISNSDSHVAAAPSKEGGFTGAVYFNNGIPFYMYPPTGIPNPLISTSRQTGGNSAGVDQTTPNYFGSPLATTNNAPTPSNFFGSTKSNVPETGTLNVNNPIQRLNPWPFSSPQGSQNGNAAPNSSPLTGSSSPATSTTSPGLSNAATLPGSPLSGSLNGPFPMNLPQITGNIGSAIPGVGLSGNFDPSFSLSGSSSKFPCAPVILHCPVTIPTTIAKFPCKADKGRSVCFSPNHCYECPHCYQNMPQCC